jgi:hypothetical protein
MVDILIDIVENAEKETKDGGTVIDYKTRLAAWDRMAELRGMIKKKDFWDWAGTVNLAVLLGNK